MGLLRWFSRPFSSKAVTPVMDDDHEQHFIRLSQLTQQIETLQVSGEPRERQGERVLLIIRQLIDDGRVHFAREKELMDSYGYVGRDSHHADHQLLLKKAEILYADLASGTALLDNSSVSFYRGWLTKHMKSHDSKLEEFLQLKRSVGKIGRILTTAPTER